MTYEPKQIPGLTRVLGIAVADIVCDCAGRGTAPSRAHIMDELRREYPELVHPRVEVPVALCLNDAVDSGILVRTDGKFYRPADKYLEKREPK